MMRKSSHVCELRGGLGLDEQSKSSRPAHMFELSARSELERLEALLAKLRTELNSLPSYPEVLNDTLVALIPKSGKFELKTRLSPWLVEQLRATWGPRIIFGQPAGDEPHLFVDAGGAFTVAPDAPVESNWRVEFLAPGSELAGIAGPVSFDVFHSLAEALGPTEGVDPHRKAGEEICARVQTWAGGPEEAGRWYRSQPIAAFGDRTAEALVKSGQASALRDYLDSIALGGFA